MIWSEQSKKVNNVPNLSTLPQKAEGSKFGWTNKIKSSYKYMKKWTYPFFFVGTAAVLTKQWRGGRSRAADERPLRVHGQGRRATTMGERLGMDQRLCVSSGQWGQGEMIKLHHWICTGKNEHTPSSSSPLPRAQCWQNSGEGENPQRWWKGLTWIRG